MNSTFAGRLRIGAVTGLLSALLAGAGCETEPADAPVKVSPESVTLKKGQSATFTASGGYSYSWSLSDGSLGVLSTRSGPATTYTSTSEPASNSTAPTVQILTVTSYVQGQKPTTGTGGGTNIVTTTSSYSVQGQAFITQLPPEPAPAPTYPKLYVEPADATIKYGQQVTLTASGGKSYAWSLGNETIGTLSPRQGPTVTYTSILASNAAVTVQNVTVSSGGTNFTAVIKHLP